MDIIELKPEDLYQIKPLWEKLNRLHRERSDHFADHFDRFTFEDRIREFEGKPHLAVFAAGKDPGEYLAYCIASADGDTGEVDSLYVDPECRGEGIGRQLMERAMAWLSGTGCPRVRISVAQGNEQALGFYETFGFKPRFVMLEQVL
jgi:ribosomal protein S18 acetylase RimI-like enzyme